jgi:hypothetical protein
MNPGTSLKKRCRWRFSDGILVSQPTPLTVFEVEHGRIHSSGRSIADDAARAEACLTRAVEVQPVRPLPLRRDRVRASGCRSIARARPGAAPLEAPSARDPSAFQLAWEQAPEQASRRAKPQQPATSLADALDFS